MSTLLTLTKLQIQRAMRRAHTWVALLALAGFFGFLIYWTLGIIDPHSPQAQAVTQMLKSEPSSSPSIGSQASSAAATSEPSKPPARAELAVRDPLPAEIKASLEAQDIRLRTTLSPNSPLPQAQLVRDGENWELRQEFLNWVVAHLTAQPNLEQVVQKAFEEAHDQKVRAWVQQGPPQLQQPPSVWIIPQFRQGEAELRGWIMGMTALVFGALLTAGIAGSVERWRASGQAWAEASAPTALWQRLWARSVTRALAAAASAAVAAGVWTVIYDQSPALLLIAAAGAGAGALLAAGFAQLPLALSPNPQWWKLGAGIGYVFAITASIGLWKLLVFPHLVWVVHHPGQWIVLMLVAALFLHGICHFAFGFVLERKNRTSLAPA